MPYVRRSIPRVTIASMLAAMAGLSSTNAEAACNPATLTCSVGSAAPKGQITGRLPTTIDSGTMDKGLIKVRVRFTIDPVGKDPLLAIEMPHGALVEATWSEKGFINVQAVRAQGAEGTIKAHYTLVPSLEASIYGVSVNYNATQLIAKVPGGAFASDNRASMPLLPWGFEGALLKGTAPALDQATVFGIPFADLGVSAALATGTLSVQAAPNPTFKYTTTSVLLNDGKITQANGTAKLAVGDDDFLDVTASVAGEVALGGTVDIRPVVKVDSADGYPTFGLVKFAFTAVSAPISGSPVPVRFENATIHIPLPNIKVPTANISLDTVKAGGDASKTITIDSTGEMGGKLTFQSSNPQFVVPSGEILVGSKSKYDLKVAFKSTSEAAASAVITVRSNDPESPEQTFKIGANGADLGSEDEGDSKGRSKGPGALGTVESEGCSLVAAGTSRGVPTFLALALGLGLVVVARRRTR